MYGCDGGTRSVETTDAWSTHSVAHGFETKVQMLNLEEEGGGGRGDERRKGEEGEQGEEGEEMRGEGGN